MCPRLLHAGGVDSPGLTASPAIALRFVALLKAISAGEPLPAPLAKDDPLIDLAPSRGALSMAVDAGVAARLRQPNPRGFHATRRPFVMPKARQADDTWRTADGVMLDDKVIHSKPGDPDVAAANAAKTPQEAKRDPRGAVLCLCERVTEAEVVDAVHRSVPATTVQGVRRRCRAGMGWCQGRRCENAVVAVVARETNCAVEEVARREWPGTSLLPQRWLGPDERIALRKLEAASRRAPRAKL